MIKQNIIRDIRDREGNKLYGGASIKEEACNHFKELYIGQGITNGKSREEMLDGIQPTTSMKDN